MRCGFGRELELTVEEGTTESIAGCHCLCGDLCTCKWYRVVYCVSWGVEVFYGVDLFGKKPTRLSVKPLWSMSHIEGWQS